mgnify:CR=1 FL=1
MLQEKQVMDKIKHLVKKGEIIFKGPDSFSIWCIYVQYSFSRISSWIFIKNLETIKSWKIEICNEPCGFWDDGSTVMRLYDFLSKACRQQEEDTKKDTEKEIIKYLNKN